MAPAAIIASCAVSGINTLIAGPDCSIVGRDIHWRSAADKEAMSHLSRNIDWADRVSGGRTLSAGWRDPVDGGGPLGRHKVVATGPMRKRGGKNEPPDSSAFM